MGEKTSFWQNGTVKSVRNYLVGAIGGLLVWTLTFGFGLERAVANVDRSLALNGVTVEDHERRLQTIEDRLSELADKDDIKEIKDDLRALRERPPQ